MAKTDQLIGIYTGAGLNAIASNLIRIPSTTGTITDVYVDLTDVADGDTEFELLLDGVLVTALTVADGVEDDTVTGLSVAMTPGSVLSLNLVGPFPNSLPDPPINLIITYTMTETHVALTGAQTVAGVKTFSDDPIIPDEVYGAGWNGSLEPPTKNALYDKIETLTGVSDGDKGDITVSASGATWTIDNGVVTYAKMQDISATSRILGRITAGSGDTEELTGSNVRTIAGLATSDSPEFTAVNIGHASDTTITRTGAGDIAVEGNAVYRAGGTDVPLADGGTGASLADPGADRIMFWDDSAGAVTWLTVGSNLTITDTTIAASGGGGGAGTFNIDDGTAAAAGTFTFDDGTAA